MRAMFAVLVAAGVAGCGLGQPSNPGLSAQAAINEELGACKAQYPKRQKGNAAQALRCSNAVYEKYSWVTAGQNGDLVRLAGLKAVEAAERYDAGKISDAQLNLELATIDSQFKTEMASRNYQSASVFAAQEQAAAAKQQAAIQQMATGLAIMSANTPPPPPPMQLPKQTDCRTYGNRTNCTTN